MNFIDSRKLSVNLSRSRRALAQPRFLLALAAMVSTVGGISFLANAQNGRAPVKMTASSPTAGKLPTLADLPAMVEAYGRAQGAKNRASSSRSAAAIGNGASGFNLVETDLTPNSNSDDREPALSPGGDFIAFASNGKDTQDINNDGKPDADGKIDSDASNAENKFHIWVMNRNGTNQRQVTGLFDDKDRDQRRPTWSPEGTQIAYIDGNGNNTELYVVDPTDSNPTASGIQVARSQRRTFFNDPAPRVNLRAPAWSPSGQTIVFSANANLDNEPGVVGNPYNLFAISPTGDRTTLQRLTGGAADTTANASAGSPVDDFNPTFSVVNSNIVYFSSNRDASGRITARRIWRIFADRTNKLQVTDPLQRANGRAGDVDDFPSTSLSNSGTSENVSFQSNSFIDASDAGANGAADTNIWSLQVAVPSITAGNTFTETEPRVIASNYGGNRLESRNPITDSPSIKYTSIQGVRSPEGIVIDGQFIYASNRDNNQIVRFDQETGRGAPVSNRGGNNFSAADSIPLPTGLISDGQFLYAGSGNSTTPSKIAIYRVSANSGNVAGTNPGSAAFSTAPDTNPDGITNGTEGLAFSAGNNRRFIYVSALFDNKINVYLKSSGRFVKTIVAPGAGTLSFPTDLEFGPDINGDTFPDLFVNSSGNDAVIAFAGPNPTDLTLNVQVGAAGNVAPGTPIATVIKDDDGNTTNLNAPEGLEIVTSDDGTVFLFVSSFRNQNGAESTGDHINRYRLTINTANPAATVAVPAPQGPTDPDIGGDATFIRFPGAKGVGYFKFNQLALDNLRSTTGPPEPTPTPVPDLTPLETSGAALVTTNILSSPNNYAASGIAPRDGSVDNVGQDKAADVEPSYSRNDSTQENADALVFSSARRYAPIPASNLPGNNGTKPGPDNPFGEAKNDIWGTTTADTTPPILIPQASGGQPIPVVAPGPQAPFPAPRTAETGLRPGSNVTIAVVLSDQQSGLDTSPGSGAAVAIIRRAGAEKFNDITANSNEAIPVAIQREDRADPETFVNLQPFDDGPVSSGGNEQQAGAVAGDGIYYCVGTVATSAAAGDFYIDVNVVDQAGRAFPYDNIWGYSTQTFSKLGLTSNLFVSDYTTGQVFPFTLESKGNPFTTSNDRRFTNEVPAESYYLTNNGGQALDPSANSIPTTFFNVDVWRILSRGAVPTTVLDTYKPRTTQQISINPQDDPTFTERNRQLVVANSYIVWAAPYAANSFVGPGTITDATTQRNLTSFLDAGGRLFVSGRDVAFALANGVNGGDSSNIFLRDELGAEFAGETFTNNIDLVGSRENGLIDFNRVSYPETYYDLQLADRPLAESTKDNLYIDGALSQQPTTTIVVPNSNGAGVRIDLITPGENATPIYAVGGSTVGQKILQNRANGLESRAVFFSFGLEGVNRRYRKPTIPLPIVALDTRLRIARGLDRYFLTNTINGTVRNDKTNLPIPNFLVSVKAGNETFLARTDENGNYELIGVPSVYPGAYVVEPAFLLNGNLVSRNTPGATTSPEGFFSGTPVAVSPTGGQTAIANLRPIPFSPGTITGRVVTSKGTPDVFTDDLPIDQRAVGMTVLLRSVNPTALTRNGGRYAQLTRTNFNGNFTFSNVPAGIALEVVFNPRKDGKDIPKETNLEANYVGPKTDVGRRVIPDARHKEPVMALVGNTYVLNDPDPIEFPDPVNGPAAGSADADKPGDSGVPIVVPEGSNISGVVFLNNAPFKAAKLELFPVASDGTLALKPLRTIATPPDGKYAFTDILGGRYVIRATIKLPDGFEMVRQSGILTVANKDQTFSFKFALSKVSGLVTLNGQPQSGVFVQLLNEKQQPVVLKLASGQSFNLVRTATTDSGKTSNYQLLNVPIGKYTLRASFGGAFGTANLTIKNGADVVAPTINLVPEKLSGVVNLRVDGVSRGGLSGAQVELLDASGKSLSPAVTTTTDAQGRYGFPLVSAGTYRVRASFKGATSLSNIFTLANGVDPTPTLTIDLQTIRVTVLSPQSKPQASASVSLLRGSTVIQTGTTNAAGQFVFVDVPAGTYSILASRSGLSQSANNVIVSAGKGVSITLQLVINGSGTTTFAANGIYTFSTPFASDGTALPIDRVFSTPLSSGAYKVYFFDAPKQANRPTPRPAGSNDPNVKFDFKEITSGRTKLIRGMGYVLQTFDRAVSTRAPSQNPDLKPFDGLTFTIPLTWNNTFLSDTFERDNRNNGFNLIGFPFDPARFRTVSFTDAQVKYGDTVFTSIDKASAAGVIARQIYTLDTNGVRVETNDMLFRPFGGYFVRILRNDKPISLILRNPK